MKYSIIHPFCLVFHPENKDQITMYKMDSDETVTFSAYAIRNMAKYSTQVDEYLRAYCPEVFEKKPPLNTDTVELDKEFLYTEKPYLGNHMAVRRENGRTYVYSFTDQRVFPKCGVADVTLV